VSVLRPTVSRLTVSRFIQARHFRPVFSARPVRLVVLHSAETPEKPGKAEAVANWFASPEAPEASAHYVVDAGATVQCVDERDVAWGAPGANHDGVHVELVGYARQSAEDWADTYSVAMLNRAAHLVAFLCDSHGLPPRALGAADLQAGARGITTHAAVSEAYRKSTHTDPGPSFPLASFVERVAEIMPGGARRA
jgi:N-acetyl-anhydromuramyl-L-alanine amidase AmpD